MSETPHNTPEEERKEEHKEAQKEITSPGPGLGGPTSTPPRAEPPGAQASREAPTKGGEGWKTLARLPKKKLVSMLLEKNPILGEEEAENMSTKDILSILSGEEPQEETYDDMVRSSPGKHYSEGEEVEEKRSRKEEAPEEWEDEGEGEDWPELNLTESMSEYIPDPTKPYKLVLGNPEVSERFTKLSRRLNLETPFPAKAQDISLIKKEMPSQVKQRQEDLQGIEGEMLTTLKASRMVAEAIDANDPQEISRTFDDLTFTLVHGLARMRDLRFDILFGRSGIKCPDTHEEANSMLDPETLEKIKQAQKTAETCKTILKTSDGDRRSPRKFYRGGFRRRGGFRGRGFRGRPSFRPDRSWRNPSFPHNRFPSSSSATSSRSDRGDGKN